MFRLNREIKLKNGEFLTPFLADGETVYCMTKNKKTVARNIKDFDFTPITKSSVLVVAPIFEEPIVQKPMSAYSSIIKFPDVVPTIEQNITIEEVISKPVSAPEIVVETKARKKKEETLDSLVVMKGKVVHNEAAKEETKPTLGPIKNEEYI